MCSALCTKKKGYLRKPSWSRSSRCVLNPATVSPVELRARAAAEGLEPAASPSPLFEDQAFSVRDPDGNVVVFGLAPQLAAEAEERPRLHGPLQHLTLATQYPATLEAFYFGKLGFSVSDRV
jgi:catechol 2,3-dioxygenase